MGLISPNMDVSAMILERNVLIENALAARRGGVFVIA
jgi:hypothetical protein